MGYDEVIPILGDFGRYQKRIYFLLCLPAIICAFHKLANVFLNAKPQLRCQLPNEFPNATYTLPPDILNSSIPWESKAGAYSQCDMYNSNGVVVHCDGYIYDRSIYHSSTVMDWDLVCNRAYWKAIGDSIFMAGVMIGSIGFGELSDRYGRKLIFFISLVTQVIFGLLAAVSPEYWTFTITRFFVGAATSGVFLVAYVIAMEMVGPSDRLAAGTICHMFFSGGYMLTALFAYYIRDWRYLQVALTIPGVAFFTYWWCIPESTRWLLTKRRPEEAKALIRKAAKVNNVNIPEDQLDALLQSDLKPKETNEKQATILDVFRHANLRKRSLIIFFDWFANSMTYYGLSWNTSNLGGNDYISFVVAGAVEIPAYTFVLMTLNKFGRKNILCGCMITAGIALLLTMAVPSDMNWLVVMLAMIGKLAITSSYGTVYIFSVEQFPTVIRNAGLGAASTSARVGSICAPMINILSETWTPFPLIIFGLLALCGGIISMVLPETLNQTLPESIADGEKFGKTVKVAEEEPLKTIELGEQANRHVEKSGNGTTVREEEG